MLLKYRISESTGVRTEHVRLVIATRDFLNYILWQLFNNKCHNSTKLNAVELIARMTKRAQGCQKQNSIHINISAQFPGFKAVVNSLNPASAYVNFSSQ